MRTVNRRSARPAALIVAIVLAGIAAAAACAAGSSPPGPAGGAPAADQRTSALRPPPSTNDAAFSRAERLFSSLKADSALAILDSLNAHAPAGDRASRLRIRLEESRILGVIGRPIPGEPLATEALAIATALRDSLSICKALRWRSVMRESLGNWKEGRADAGRLLDLATRRGDREHQAQAWLCIAYADLNTGSSSDAVREHRRAIKLFQDTGNKRFELIALAGLARSLSGTGERDAGRQCYERVVQGSREIGDPWNEATALSSLGALDFDDGDPAAAARSFARAFRIQKENGNPLGSISPATNLAVAQTYLGILDDAEGTLREAMRICEREGYRTELAQVVKQLAYVEKTRGRLPEAAALFRKSAHLSEAGSVDTWALSLVGLAETLGRLDSLDAAIAVIERTDPVRESIASETAAVVDRMAGDLLLERGDARPALRRFMRSDRLAEPLGIGFRSGPLANAARCLLLLGKADSARAVLLDAAGIWEQERSRSVRPEWRERLGVDARLLYGTLAEVILDHGGRGTAEDRARAAFDALQQFKARTLEERMLGPADADTLRRIGRIVTAAELQASVLRPGEVFVDAFLGPDAGYLFCISRDRCSAQRIPIDPDTLEARLRDYRGLLAGGEVSASEDQVRFVRAAGRRLSRDMLGPAESFVRSAEHVLYSPDGALNLVPLSVLIGADAPEDRTGRRAGDPDGSAPQVIRVPSASVLAEIRSPRPAEARSRLRPLLAVAAGSTRGDPDLPGARAEARALHRAFRGADLDVDEPDGRARAAASGPTSRPDITEYAILHFAGHSHIDDAAPWRSGILRGRAAPDSGAYLRAGTIARMRLPADLVVLSGCETAGGGVLSGEGVLGLTAAFTAAGVPSVIATLWPVDDATTARLVRSLYRSLGRGRTVADALSDAQAEIRRRPETAHPFYWAGFVLIGEGGTRVALRRRSPVGPVPLWAPLLPIAVAVAFRAARGGRRRASVPGEIGPGGSPPEPNRSPSSFSVISGRGGALKK